MSVKNRKDNEDLESFWPRGNKYPIMFVDVVGQEGQDIGSSKREAKVGVDSKYNEKEANLVVSCSMQSFVVWVLLNSFSSLAD